MSTAEVTPTDHQQENWGPMVDVTSVRVLSRYVLELTFDTGEIKVIDVEPLLLGPIFERIRSDYSYFTQVSVDPDAGTIVWPDEEDISPHTLYSESKPAIPA